MNSLPKIDLHCHLDGSLRVETVKDIAYKENIKLPTNNISELKKYLQVEPECNSLIEYLEKFSLPVEVMQTKESLKRVTYELIEDVSSENVKYIEIRFAPMLHTKKGLSIKEVIKSVLEGMNEGCNKFDIKANLILSCMRNMGEENTILVIEEGKEFLNKGVVAIDLCGPEEEGFSRYFEKSIKLAKSYGYNITIHAGEAGSGNNVIEAINLLGAQRIGHGVRINDMKEAYDLVKEYGVVLEMCPTSNVQTKAIDSLDKHPFYDFYKSGLNVTINTDNRTVSNIDLTNEINLIKDNFSMNENEYKDIYLKSVDSTFADDKTKDWLRSLI